MTAPHPSPLPSGERVGVRGFWNEELRMFGASILFGIWNL